MDDFISGTNMSENIAVLVVDDDDELRKITIGLLPTKNLTILEAADGKTALDLIHVHHPDMVISDMIMPETEGLDLCLLVKSDPKIKHTFFVLLTGYKTTPEDRIQGLDAKADSYITRPISNRELKAKLNSFLRIVAAEKQVRESNARLEYLKAIIEAIQKVNRLIAKTSDVQELIEKTCQSLISEMGYNNTWIALCNENEEITHVASAGFDQLNVSLEDVLTKKGFLACMEKTRLNNKLVVIQDPAIECKNCPLSHYYKNYCGLCALIEYKDRIYGWLTISAIKKYANDETQWQLLNELASDLGFALQNLELKSIHQKTQINLDNFAKMAAQTRDFIAIINKDYTLQLANPATCELFETQQSLIVGMHLQDVIGDELFKRFSDEHLQKAFTGEMVEFVSDITTNQGPTRHYQIKLTPDHENEPVEHVFVLGTEVTEIIKTQKKLEKSEQKYRHLYQSIPSGIAIVSIADGKIQEANDILCYMLGYSPKEFIGKSIHEITHPEDQHIDEEAIEERLHGHHGLHLMNKRMLKKDGSIIWVSITTSVIDFEESEPKHVLGVILDNTELFNTALALKDSEKRYRTVAENFPNGTLSLFDKDFTYEFVDGKGLALVGLKKEDLIGKSIYELFPEDIVKTKEKAWKEVFKGKSSEYELNYNGRVFINRALPIKEPNSEITRGAAFSQDITEIRKYEQEQQKNQTLLELSEEMSLTGSFEIDYNTKALTVSKGWQEIVGIRKATLDVNLDLWKYVYEEDKSRVLEAYNESLKSKSEYRIEHRIIHHETGEIRLIKILAKTNFDTNSNPISSVGTIQDITEQRKFEEEKKQIEAELQQSQKMEAIGHLAGGVAHDFNNIIQSMLGYSQLLLGNLPNDSEEYNQVLEIFKGSERASSLTRQLLAFGRRQIIEPQAIDLNLHISSIMDMLNRTTKENIQLEFEPMPNLLKINFDKHQLTQVILNLVLNAKDAMPDGGEIMITTTQESIDEDYIDLHFHGVEKPDKGFYVMMHISDNGQGMNDETLRHIFEPFFSTKPLGKGVGLGLSSVYGIVRQHKGAISVHSDLGKGSSFDIYFPALPLETKNGEENETQQLEPVRGSGTILFAEDNEVLRKLTKKVVGDYGYNLLIAKDGQEAIELGTKNIHRIDIIILDAVMPKKNGIEVYQVLHELRPDLPVIFTSGYTESEIHNNFILKHGLTYFQKPYSLSVLLAKIKELTD